MKSILRGIACLSSLVALAASGQLAAQMPGQNPAALRASAYPAPSMQAPRARPPLWSGANPAATGYSYGSSAFQPGAASPRRPVARVAQNVNPYGPAVEAFSAEVGNAATSAQPYAANAVVAPAQHIVAGGGGCVGGGGAGSGYAGGGVMTGGDVSYGGGYGGYGGGYDNCGGCAEPVYAPAVDAAPKWFGGFYGLIMNRDDENEVYYLTEPAVADNLFLSSRDAEMEFSGGYEVRFGRVFNEGAWGLEFVYWELFPDDQIASVQTAQTNAANMYATTDYRDVFLDPAADTIANTFTETGALVAVRLRRSWDFQNIELNLLSGPLYGGSGPRAGQATPFGAGCAGDGGGCYGGSGYGPSVGGCDSGCGPAYAPSCGTGGCGSRLQVGWLAGVRYFKFNETLGLDYDIADNIYDGGVDEFRHDVRVENDLVGAQLGLNLNYCLTSRLSIDGGTKFGLFGNNMSTRQTIQNDDGLAYTLLGGNRSDFDVTGDEEDIAFLGEMRFGAAYKIGCHWRLSGGYRAMALSGVALATNQLPYARSYTDLGKVGDVDRNGHLILHGAYAGVEFCW